jgi:hypothetical protein
MLNSRICKCWSLKLPQEMETLLRYRRPATREPRHKFKVEEVPLPLTGEDTLAVRQLKVLRKSKPPVAGGIH